MSFHSQASIRSANSPTQFVVDIGNGDQTITLEGQALAFCNRPLFSQWTSNNLLGKALAVHAGKWFIQLSQSQWIDLEELLVRNGYIFNVQYSDSLAIAASERRGEWNCSDKKSFFKMVLKDDGYALVVGAIAYKESKYKGHPWPWSINVQGTSNYFETRELAHQFMQNLLRQGIVNFDIGLTQINWKYHGNRFKSTWEALQPIQNILMSKVILKELLVRQGDFSKAIACYHNCTDKERGSRYYKDFLREYEQLAGK